VVYRADDTRLGRSVALKFLPEEVSRNPQALERFKREARTASALNHPNICTIHDIDAYQGHPFLVMELLEGETLRGRLAGSPLKLERLLEVALQIASGLEAAHAKGIVHRDIKPSNVFLTNSGQVRIVAFGLAKPVASGARRALGAGAATTTGVSAVPTVAMSEELLTSPGMAVGTVAYMSPEQARGEEPDTRTDVFSFGVVLYEMATGTLPFQGNSLALTFDAILNKEPISALELNPKLPAELDRIISKALEKDRDLRYQSTQEIRTDLRRLQRQTESARVATPALPRRRALPRWWPLALTGTLAVVLGAFLAVRPLRLGAPSPERMPELRQRQITTNPPEDPVVSAAISPDGRYVAYADLSGVHIRLITTGETRRLPMPPDFCFR